ncbi:MAG: Acetyltransferase, GNAT family, partial [uncultured Gemmatimonadetes bacterium]
ARSRISVRRPGAGAAAGAHRGARERGFRGCARAASSGRRRHVGAGGGGIRDVRRRGIAPHADLWIGIVRGTGRRGAGADRGVLHRARSGGIPRGEPHRRPRAAEAAGGARIPPRRAQHRPVPPHGWRRRRAAGGGRAPHGPRRGGPLGPHRRRRVAQRIPGAGGLHAATGPDQRRHRGHRVLPGGAGRAPRGRRHAQPGRRRGPAGRRQHPPRSAPQGSAARPPGSPPALRSGARLPAGHDGRPPRQRLPAQRRAPGLPHRLHPHQVAPGPCL